MFMKIPKEIIKESLKEVLMFMEILKAIPKETP